MSGGRSAEAARETGETQVRVRIALDGAGLVRVDTGIGFFDHMLHALGFHAGWDLEASCQGDLDVDDHHTVEDVALVLGGAVDQALGGREGIARFGWAYAPMDEALARAVADVSGRPCFAGDLTFRRERLGALSCETIPHFFESFAQTAKLALHVDVLRGANDHHRAEAAFKSAALALRAAFAKRAAVRAAQADGAAPAATRVPSTKGVL